MTVSIGLGPNFSNCRGLCWVSQLMGWVGSGHTKLTHGQVCPGYSPITTNCNQETKRFLIFHVGHVVHTLLPRRRQSSLIVTIIIESSNRVPLRL